MADYISVNMGADPWRPAPSAETVEVWDRYDGPTCGLLRQSGVYHTFECLDGNVDAVSVWRYMLVEPAEADELNELEGELFRDRLDEMYARRPTLVAVSFDKFGILGKATHAVEEPFKKAVVEALRDAAEAARQMAHEMTSQVEFASSHSGRFSLAG